MNSDIRISIESKYKKGNQLLFSRESKCLWPLLALMEIQKHRTLVLWALDCAQVTLSSFEEKYPKELRPRKALELSDLWAKGMIKMPQAKRAILDAHALARELKDKEGIALAHGIGHAGATVHVGSHAPGLVFYELTAMVHRQGLENFEQSVNQKIQYYDERLLYWQAHMDDKNISWAKFLCEPPVGLS